MTTDPNAKKMRDAAQLPAENMKAEVGRCHPPIHTRFKPGQSGNPTGRPKRTFDLAQVFAEELAELTPDNNGNLITNARAIARVWIERAKKGDPKFIIPLMPLLPKPRRDAADPHTAEDDAFVEKLAASESQAADGKPQAGDDELKAADDASQAADHASPAADDATNCDEVEK